MIDINIENEINELEKVVQELKEISNDRIINVKDEISEVKKESNIYRKLHTKI